MCGITGKVSFKSNSGNDESQCLKALNLLRKRGPDHSSLYKHHNVVLGHSRLSIIDKESRANQPMVSGDGNYVLSFNGEIYNFKTLRKELQSEGCEFKTESDTEVLLSLLIHDGLDCLKKLNGFFAFAFFNKRENSLVLARDRFGIKPLYFYCDENQFVFGSELKAIYAYDVPMRIDSNALTQYFQLSYVPGNESIIQGCQKVLPGEYIYFANSQIPSFEKSQYYFLEPPSVQREMNYEFSETKVREMVIESVEKRLVSDVPLACFLSGGIDSSIISYAAKQVNPLIECFTIGFPEHKFIDESKFARDFARTHKLNHRVLDITKNDLKESVCGIWEYMDEPFSDPALIGSDILCNKVSNYAKVALSGDGADEIFGGYNKHLAEHMISKNGYMKGLNAFKPLMSIVPSSRSGYFSNKVRQINKLLEITTKDFKSRYWFLASLMNQKQTNELLLRNASIDDNHFECRYFNGLIELLEGKFNTLQASLWLDQKMVLPDDMLRKTDVSSMRHSLEVRTPFLDHKLVEYINKMPSKFKINGGVTKLILRKAFHDIFPEKLLKRKKQGFDMPLRQWMRNDFDDIMEELVYDKKHIENQGLFEYNFIDTLNIRNKSQNPGDSDQILWSLLNFQIWFKNHKPIIN